MDKIKELESNIAELEIEIYKKKSEIQVNMKELYKERFKRLDSSSPCSCDYYEIRAGKCKYGEIGGHAGKVFCKHPNCKEYIYSPND